MKLINIVESFSEDDLLADLAAALAASFTAALLTSLISIMNRHRVDLVACLRFIVLAVAAYSTVALLLHQFWTGLLKRIAPNWILIVVFGSILFVALDLIPGIIKGWYDPLRMESSLYDYMSTEIDAARSVIIILGFVTLPVAGSIYYAFRKILKGLTTNKKI